MDEKGCVVSSACKRCKSKVVNGVKCTECASSYHLSCAKKLNNITFLNNTTIRCCESALKNGCDAEFFDAVDGLSGSERKVDIAIFNYILKQKDIIISDLRDQIKILNTHIDKLNSSGVMHKKVIDKEQERKTDTKKTNVIISKNNNDNKSKHISCNQTPSTSEDTGCVNKPSHITKAQVAVAVEEAETQRKCKEYINIDRNNKSNNDGEWKKIVKKRRNKSPLVIGNSIESNSVFLKGVPKMITLHVYKLDPDTEAENLKKFLEPNFPEVICDTINPRHPDLYSSFKVSILEENFQKAMDPSKWPKNACVSRFLYLMKREERNKR